MLTWYAQEQPTLCVAACVRMVLTGFGLLWTEGQVRTLLGRPRLGITLTAAHVRLVQAGARATLHEAWKQLPGNLSRKDFVPIRGKARGVPWDYFSIFVVLYCGDPSYADPQTALSR